MAFGKIRRWITRKSGVGPIGDFRRWAINFACVFRKAISTFRRWVLRKTPLESEDVARGHAPMRVRIVGADAADQAKPLQRCQMVVQGRDGHFRVLGQPRLGGKAAVVRVVAVAEQPEHDLGGRLQPALGDGLVGGGVAHWGLQKWKKAR